MTIKVVHLSPTWFRTLRTGQRVGSYAFCTQTLDAPATVQARRVGHLHVTWSPERPPSRRPDGLICRLVSILDQGSHSCHLPAPRRHRRLRPARPACHQGSGQRGAAQRVIGLIRNEQAAGALQAEGIRTRIADYGNEAALADALAGADRVLLISSSEVGQRLPQHSNVIKAAKAAGVKRLAYTSILRPIATPCSLRSSIRRPSA